MEEEFLQIFTTLFLCQKRAGFDVPVDLRKMLATIYIDIRKKECCQECGDLFVMRDDTPTEDGYMQPSATIPITLSFCSEKCHCGFFDNFENDFAFWYCECCQRHICQRNTMNGYEFYFKEVDDDFFCLECAAEKENKAVSRKKSRKK